MRVKRYVADSIQEAITRVKNDLGRNAIILHTKPFKEGGFLGFFCKRRFEVIAAVDETISNEPAVATKKEDKPQPISSGASMAGAVSKADSPVIKAKPSPASTPVSGPNFNRSEPA